MRQLSVLLCLLLLTGCVVSSPQKAQFNAEYPNRQDIRSHTVYRFMTKPLQPGGGKYYGANDLAETLYVRADNAAMVELRFNYPGRSLQVKSLDAQNRTLRDETYALLDESAAKPSDAESRYFFLSKEGVLLTKFKNCTPDMSVGCRWQDRTLFITRSGDMAVQLASGTAGMAFLVIPFYGSEKYLEIFPKVSGT